MSLHSRIRNLEALNPITELPPVTDVYCRKGEKVKDAVKRLGLPTHWHNGLEILYIGHQTQ